MKKVTFFHAELSQNFINFLELCPKLSINFLQNLPRILDEFFLTFSVNFSCFRLLRCQQFTRNYSNLLTFSFKFYLIFFSKLQNFLVISLKFNHYFKILIYFFRSFSYNFFQYFSKFAKRFPKIFLMLQIFLFEIVKTCLLIFSKSKVLP